MADLTLEESEARRLAAEQEAQDAQAQLARERQRTAEAVAQARLDAQLGASAEISALKRDLAALTRAHSDTRDQMETAFGENGVSVNGGITHGSGTGGNTRPADELPLITFQMSIAGVIYDVQGRIQVLG